MNFLLNNFFFLNNSMDAKGSAKYVNHYYCIVA